MWIILFAILLLCVLVFINKKREGFTSLHILTIYNILMDKTTDSEGKMKLLKDPSLIINDVPITSIINSENLSNEEKILKIKLHIDSLIDKRNAKPEHVDNVRIIDYDTFFNVIKIIENPTKPTLHSLINEIIYPL
jgi:hypothetical protein